jgi:hypothetical protein
VAEDLRILLFNSDPCPKHFPLPATCTAFLLVYFSLEREKIKDKKQNKDGK